jgi:hypothetical protein
MKKPGIYGRLTEQEDSAQNLGMPGALVVIDVWLEMDKDALYVVAYINQGSLKDLVNFAIDF